MKITLRDAELKADARGMAFWSARLRALDVAPAQCAIVVCDVWDNHWCKGAVVRLNELVPRMNRTLQAARQQGMHIIHAPSDTLAFYADSPARARILQAPAIDPPADLAWPDPPLPIDDSDHGADTGESEPAAVWTRQHPGVEIAEGADVISDSGREILAWLRHTGCLWVFIMGVHTNMCVLHRTFGIKQMVRWGVRIALIRDLTDCMYNPARPPYVSHAEGTDLVVGYIEKHWCPTVASQDIAGSVIQ